MALIKNIRSRGMSSARRAKYSATSGSILMLVCGRGPFRPFVPFLISKHSSVSHHNSTGYSGLWITGKLRHAEVFYAEKIFCSLAKGGDQASAFKTPVPAAGCRTKGMR